jgi:ketosteroid isomerase-like protein
VGQAETLRAIYEAFGRGDVPAILDRLSDDVAWDVWKHASPVQDVIPYIAPRTGKEGVQAFFACVLNDLEFHQFDVANIMQGGDQCAAAIDFDITVKATGKRIQDLEMHLWTFGPDGKVTAFRHVFDTAKHVEAQRP